MQLAEKSLTSKAAEALTPAAAAATIAAAENFMFAVLFVCGVVVESEV